MKQLFFSLLLILSINQVTSQNCPAYSNSTQGTNEACGNQNYTLMIPNTGCNGEIYINIQTNYANGYSFSWELESVLTGNVVGSGTNGNTTTTIGPINPNTQGNTFDLILNDPNGWGLIPGEYVEASQGATVLAHLTSVGHSIFAANITISSATISITTPSGIITEVSPQCKDFIVQVPLANSDFCSKLTVDLPWEIKCNVNQTVLASGTHTVTVNPSVPTSADDLVDITWNPTTCSWDVSANNDCDLLDIGSIFTISPDPNSLDYGCASGNETFDVEYLGFPNSPDCCETAGPVDYISYNTSSITGDAMVISSPFGGTNNAAHIHIPANNSGGNATSLSLCVDVSNYCRVPIGGFFSTDNNSFYVFIFIDNVQVYMSPQLTTNNHNICIDLNDVPTGYNQSSTIDIYILPNTFYSGSIYTHYTPQKTCSSITQGEWLADINVSFDAEFEEMIGTPVVCTFNITESYLSCGITPPTPVITTTAPTCDNDGISTITNFDPSYTYDFTPTGPSVNPDGVIINATLGQIYEVIANDAGCTSPPSTFINEEQLEEPGYTVSITEPTCNNDNGEIIIMPTSGANIAQYSIDNGATTQTSGVFSNLDAGTYSILVISDEGCQATSVETLNDLGTIYDASFDLIDFCEGESNGAQITGDAGGTFSILSPTNDGANIHPTTGEITNGVEGTTYTVEYAFGGLCPISEVQTITVLAIPNFSLTSVNPTTCSSTDGEITLSGLSPNTSYTVSYTGSGATIITSNTNGEIILSNLAPGTYNNFTVTAPTGCEFTYPSSISLTSPDNIMVNTAGGEICEGNSAIITAEGFPAGGTYLWSNGETTPSIQVNPSSTTTYSVTYSVDGCDVNEDALVIVNSLPNVNAGEDVQICENKTVTLNGSGAVSYVWNQGINNGVPFIPPAGTTTYTVTGTDANGCVNTDDVSVTVSPMPAPYFVGENLYGCAPLTASFTNMSTIDNNSVCRWDFGNGTTSNNCHDVTATYTQGGNYSVSLTIIDQNECSATYTAHDYVEVTPSAEASFTANPMIVSTMNPEVTFTNTSNNANQYIWNFGDGSHPSTTTHPTHLFPDDESNSYVVTLIAINGEPECNDTTSMLIQVMEETIFYVPNSFTPDGDMYNETFKPIFTSGFDLFTYTLEIYNRWGETLFVSHDVEMGWDGTYGEGADYPAPNGVYVWKIKIREKNKDKFNEYVGHVTLSR